MFTGTVTGTVVASVKEENLHGIPLLTVKLIENGKEAGTIVAADSTRQAGPGDFVYLIGSREAAKMFRKDLTPVDAAIVGFIDTYNEELPLQDSNMIQEDSNERSIGNGGNKRAHWRN